MRSVSILSFLAPALLSGVSAAPFNNGAACGLPAKVTTYVTESHYTPPPEPPTTSISPPVSTSLPPTATTSISPPESSSTSSFTSIPVSSSTSLPASSSTSTPGPSASCRPTSWTREGHAPSVGKLRAALIFVDFPDMPANTSVSELYSLVETAPAELYKQMSYGKLELELVPLLDKFYRMPAASSSYNYSRALTTEAHLKYINDALTAVGPSVSFAGIDVLYVLPAKYASEISTSTATSADVTALDGTVIGNSVTFGQDLYFSWGYKTVNHETGHTLGLPDLYPYVGGTVPQWVGGFDLMGLIGGQSPDYLAWHKWQLGWVADNQVECIASAGKTTHRLSPIEVAGETTKAIAVPLNGTAYLLAEVRSGLGIDAGACGTGVLLYTANTAVSGGSGPIRVIDSKPNSNGCGNNNGGELNDAPLAVGTSFNTGLGVVVTVTGQEGDDYIIEVEQRI
ncbi:M6 metalloprotease [Lindgomyces ingoldianus]|uniref:M6 metalloprotease n=1 Tax=Lindgomyces ingoldianus TaxID=673940 RepID=A0ACB6QL91_9PLEO|nr:M6 metalloprotease [Lindgomyces ingoldianus]KAF2467779.1 M6 metalloprotease [Lindgomyces ingoldianus]